MAAGVLVGRGYVSIRPEFEGNWSRRVRDQSQKAGTDGGGAFGKAFGAATSVGFTALKASLAGAGIAGAAAAMQNLAAASALAAPALATAATAGGALALGMHGVGDAFKAAFSDSSADAAKAASATRAVESAQRSLAKAQEGVKQAQVDAARAVADAQKQVIQAQRDVRDATEQAAQANAQAAQQVQSAERDLAGAQMDSKRAQLDLNDARVQAKKDLEDLNTQLQQSSLDERSAALRVQQAKAELDKTTAAGSKATTLQREQAQLAYDQAVFSYNEQKKQAKELAAQVAAADKAGVEGSDKVIAAHQKVADAQQNITDKARALKAAQADQSKTARDGAQSVVDAQQKVKDAQEGVVRAQQDGAQRISDAQAAVADAARAVAEAQAAAAAQTSALDQAMAKLAPNARSFVTAVQGLAPAWSAMQKGVQNNLFAALGAELTRTANATLPTLGIGLRGAATQLNLMAVGALRAVTEMQRVGLLKGVFDTSNAALANFIQTPGQIITAFGQLTNAAGPAWIRVTGLMGAAMTSLTNKLNAGFTSGGLQSAISTATEGLVQLVRTVLDVLKVVWNLMSAMNAAGTQVLGVIGQLFAELARITALPEIQAALGQIFGLFAQVAQIVASSVGILVQGLLPLIGQVAAALAPVVTALGPIVTQLASGLVAAIGPIITALTPALTTVGLALVQMVQVIVPLLTPVAALLTSIISALVPAIAPIVTILATIVGQLAGPLGAIVTALTPVFATLARVIGQIAGTLATALLPVVTLVATTVAAVFTAIAPVLGPLIALFGQLAQVLLGALATAFQTVATAVTPIVVLIANTLGGVLKAILPAVTAVVTSLATAFTIVFKALLPLIPLLYSLEQQVLAALLPVLPVLAGALGQIVAVLAALLPPIAMVVAQVAGALLPLFKVLAPVLAQVASTIATALMGVLPVLVNALTLLIGAVAPIIGLVGQLAGMILGLGVQLLSALLPPVGLLISALVRLLVVIVPLLTPIIEIVSTIIRWGVAILALLLPPIIQLVGYLLGPLVTAVSTVIGWFAKVASFLATVLGPVFRVFATIVSGAWKFVASIIGLEWAIIKSIFNVIVAVIKGVLIVAWNALKGVINNVWAVAVTAIRIAWAIIKGIFGVIKGVLTGDFAGAWKSIKNTISSVWDAIKKLISSVWTGSIRPVFNAIKTAIAKVGDAFGTAKDAIATAWDKIKDATKKPINWVIDTVWNKGIVPIWDKIVGWIPGVPHLGKLKLLEAGGTIGAGFGQAATPGVYNRPTAIVGEGRSQWPEYVIPTDPRYRGRAQALHAAAGTQLMASGGIIGDLWGGIKSVVGSAVGGIKSAAQFLANPISAFGKMIKPVTDGIKSLTGTTFGKMVAGLPTMAITGLKNAVASAAASLFGGSGGERVGKALAWAKTQAGKPYQWGGTGNPSWDCSGFMGGIQSEIQGKNPNRRLWTTHAFNGKTAPAGWEYHRKSPFMVGVTSAGVGHTAGTLAGTNVESSGGAGVRVGGGARGYSNGLFGGRWYGYVPAIVKGPSGFSAKAAGGAQQTALQMLGQFGWPASQFGPLKSLWQAESGWRWNAKNPSSGAYGIPQCHSMDTLILTRRGWLSHDEVQVGDETIGYNPAVGRSEWTPVLEVIHPGEADLYRVGNQRFSATCTHNHRWLMERMVNDRPVGEEMVELRHHLGRRHRLVLARPADTDTKLDISVTEAALLGWIAGDGWQVPKKVYPRKTPDRGRTANHRPMTYHVCASRTKRWAYFEKLASEVPALRRSRERHGVAEWRMSAPAARDLTARSGGNPKTSTVAQVLAMSTEQREAWLEAVLNCDGYFGEDYTQVSQKVGPIADAIMLAVYLAGARPSIQYTDRRSANAVLTIGIAQPFVGMGRATVEYESTGEVWCVRTGLGTWTAEQDGQIFLTGNSLPANKMASAGSDWRTNPATQIKWGLGYIRSVYGSPAYAWSTWQGRSPHWYDGGGMLQPGGIGLNGTTAPEPVLTGAQWTDVRRYLPVDGQTGGGVQAGDSLRLVVDGYEFTAYVDARADGRVAAGSAGQARRLAAGRKR